MNETDFIRTYPVLYHMAEDGSWPNIQKYGLLSTSGLLDLYRYTGEMRKSIEGQHRRESVSISANGLPPAIIRDQKPLDDESLRQVLPSDVSPEDWYGLLNSKTFFWTSKDRLLTLLNARAYRNRSHEVLSVCTKSLVQRHAARICVCPINSGSTLGRQKMRDKNLFLPLGEFFTSSQNNVGRNVVEVTVEGGVPDIRDCVIKVRKVHGSKVLRTIWDARNC